MAEPRIEVRAVTNGSRFDPSVTIRVKVGNRVVLDSDLGAESETDAMVWALGEAIGAVARADEARRRAARRRARR